MRGYQNECPVYIFNTPARITEIGVRVLSGQLLLDNIAAFNVLISRLIDPKAFRKPFPDSLTDLP